MRPPWGSLPPPVQSWVASVLGSPVVAARSESGGFSPGVAARVRCASGRTAFVKAATGEVDPGTTALHRREAVVTAALPPSAGAPGLLGVLDDDGWVALVLEEVDGRPPRLPWEAAELDACLGLLDRLAVALTPSPLSLEAAADLHPLDGWARLASAGTAFTPWEERHLDRLLALERSWPQASAGATLLHLDARADNLLVRRDGQAVLVDWPHAAVGHPVCDLAFLAPSVVLDGGPACEALLPRSAVGRAAEPERLDAVVAALAGFFQHRSRQPAPAGMQSVRRFQARQGRITLRWLAERTGWA